MIEIVLVFLAVISAINACMLILLINAMYRHGLLLCDISAMQQGQAMAKAFAEGANTKPRTGPGHQYGDH